MIFAYPEPRTIHSRQDSPPPPASPPHSNTPEIDGSSGGYIALVIILAAIVVACCVGVFFLLRSHRNDPYERNARRALAGKHEESIYKLPLGPPGIRQKFKKFFTFGRKRDGWVRTSSGDEEWDASDRLVYDAPRELDEGGSRWISGTTLYDAPREAASTPKSRVQRSETSDSIELTVPPSSVPRLSDNPAGASVASMEPSHAELYTDPFSSPTTMRPSEALPVGEEYEPHAPREDERRFTVRSADASGHEDGVRSMRKFESGTKFKEALEF